MQRTQTDNSFLNLSKRKIEAKKASAKNQPRTSQPATNDVTAPENPNRVAITGAASQAVAATSAIETPAVPEQTPASPFVNGAEAADRTSNGSTQPNSVEPSNQLYTRCKETFERINKGYKFFDFLFSIIYWGHWSKVQALRNFVDLTKKNPTTSSDILEKAKVKAEAALKKHRFMPFFTCCRKHPTSAPIKDGAPTTTPAA